MTEPAVSLRGVAVRYGTRYALREVDLDVPTGQRVAVVGPSGAGKSTLLKLCNGMLQPSAGEVHVLGEDLARCTPRRLTEVRRRVAVMDQGLHLVGPLRVVHNVNAGRLGQWPWWRSLFSLLRPLEVDRARAALADLGIADALHSRTDQLSGGEQQRVALARVLVQDPALILADEPVSSLDPARAEDVMRQLCDKVSTGTRTLVVSLHDFDLAVQVVDRVVGVRSGRVVFDLAAREVEPRHKLLLYDLGSTAWP